MRRALIHIISAIVAILAFCRCSVDGRDGFDAFREDAPALHFVLHSLAEFTRSTVITDDESVIDANVFVFSDGVLVRRGFCQYSNPDDVDEKGWVMPLSRDLDGYDYNVYVLANVGYIEAPESETDMNSLKITAEHMNGYAPMYWKGNITSNIIRSRDVAVPLTRMVARINFAFDASGVDGMKVYSVRICQAPKSISPFSGSPNVPASPQEVFDAGDVQFDNAFRIKDDPDVFELDSLRTASFYAFENMQGTPLGENDDPWKKMPSSVGSLGTLDPAKAALCTYIEVATRFSIGSKYYGQVVYKLFLGKDAVKNFDIERNHTINVTLKVTEHGFDRDSVSWKIDTLNLFRDKNVRNLTMYLAQKQQRMVIGEIKSLSLDPDVPDVLENGRLKIAYNGSDKESYSISALEVGSDTVYVTLIDPLLSEDNPEGLSNEFVSKMCVDVLAPKLNFRWKNAAVSGAGVRDSIYLAMDGESKTLIPYYTDTSYLHEMKRGDQFDKDLYDQLLSTVIIADSLDSQYIGSKESKTPLSHDIWLQALKSVGAQPLDGHGFGFISVAAVSPDIDTLKCRPYTENPFQGEADKTFVSTSLVNSSTDEQFIFPLGQLKEYTGNSDGFYRYRIGTPTQPKGNPCSATLFNGESINIRWLYGSNGDLNIPSLNEHFFGIVANRYSAQEWYSPILYNASFTVHVAIGAVGEYGSEEKIPDNWFIRARWAHTHYNSYNEMGASPLAQFDKKIISTTKAHIENGNNRYIKGIGTLLYRLTWYEDVTKVPASLGADFYKTHEPDFGITDVTTYNSDGSVKPDFVDVTPDNPYRLPLSGYDIRVHYYKDVSGHPTNWIGVK